MDNKKKEQECSGNCETCPDKTFDSESTYEFICNKYGWVVS